MDTDKLAEVLAKATPGPWQVHGSHFYGPDPGRILIGQMWGGGPFDANLALISMAPDLADEVIRLRAENADLIRANAVLMVRNDALLAFVEEVRDYKPDVISGRRREPDLIEAATFYAFQADAEKLAPKPKKDAA